MKYFVKLLLAILVLCLVTQLGYAQCNLGLITIEQCDMENVDFDTDGSPDGIINLYQKSGVTPQAGDEWESTGMESASFALDNISGEVRLWKLRNASDQYFFTLKK